jgi:hypothetical protein
MSSDANDGENENARIEDPVLLYSRGLPGGGIVTIEALSKENPAVTARISVERRIDPQRRDGHEPPVIAEAKAPTQSTAFKELYQIASDNVAVARGLIQWQARRRDDPAPEQAP